MKLPNADLALIESAKQRNYLLSPNHPIGRFGQATEYGQKYEVHGILTGPAEKAVELVSVGIILEGDDLTRFITAFPGGK